MRIGLNEGLPWSTTDRIGFLVSAFGSAMGFSLLVASGGASSTINPVHAFPFMLTLLLLLNLPEFRIKRLGWYWQYVVCVGASVCSGTKDMALANDGLAMLTFIHLFMGALIFFTCRVNWWFLWDNPHRRTVAEKALASIFYTSIAPLGMVMGVYRLFGVGVEPITTTFVVEDENSTVLETTISDPALAEHARRMDAIRTAQAGVRPRPIVSDKDAISESI
jgi:hypothetical protein